MKTLALYVDDDGAPQQCVITHNNTMFPDWKDFLPNFQVEGVIFLIDMAEDENRPYVVDEFFDEVPCHFVTI
jgi:hypothetical protein